MGVPGLIAIGVITALGVLIGVFWMILKRLAHIEKSVHELSQRRGRK